MKTKSLIPAILLILFILSSSFGQAPTPGIVDVSDLSAIKIRTATGEVVSTDVRDALANFPALAPQVKQALRQHLNGLADDTEAAKRWKDIQARNVPLPQATIDAINTRIEAHRARKEAALRNVASTDPRRAATKMAELLANGVPITPATQAIVNAAQPTPAPTSPPAPTPNDGL